MADVEKKARLSGEQSRAAESAPATATNSVLPTTEKPPPPPQASLHPAFYVVYVPIHLREAPTTNRLLQDMDRFQWRCYPVQ